MGSPVSTLKRAALLFVPQTAQERKILWGINQGVKMHLDLKSDTQTHCGLAERELAPYFTTLSKGIHTAIDVGGAQGYYALFFLLKTNAKRVFVFEPEAECLLRLAHNLNINGLDSDPRLSVSTRLVGSTNNDRYATLDSLLPEIKGPCLIKIDVEEAEIDVLAGAEKLLKTPGVRWIVETHTPELERECQKIFRQHGLKTKIVDKAWWRKLVPELRPRPHNRWLIAI